MSVSFAKYKKQMAASLDLATQEQWRERFAVDVVKLAQESDGRDDLLQRLHDATAATGFEFKKIGSGGTRAVFALPFGLALKVCVVGPAPDVLPVLSPNVAELERSEAFPAFVPRCYGDVYRSLGEEAFDQSIDALIVERVIPLHEFTDHLTVALGSTNNANLGVCPRSGRLMVLDTGSAWAESVEQSFLDRSHPLMQFPFMWAPRW